MSEVYDAVVVGGGPAGSVAAMRLAQLGAKVMLAHDPLAPPSKAGVGESLPGAARPLLQALGLLAILEKGHRTAYGTLSSWGEEALHTLDFIVDKNGTGWHLDRPRFDADLRTAASERGAIVLEKRLSPPERHDSVWDFSEGIQSSFVIDATGRQGAIARGLGAKVQGEHELFAIYCFVETGETEESRTLMEAAPKGWWYTAPLPGNQALVVFHTDRENCKRLLSVPRLWKEQLSETLHLSERLSGLNKDVELLCTEAGSRLLSPFVGDAWLACGDAAMAFDPLSSQGLLNAIYTGMRGGEAVAGALQGIGLETYANRLDKIWESYRRHLDQMYALEQRWPEESFWKQH
ncbi:MAG: tryptophan 7-halogenase [Bdellovibrionota bacterium]